MSKNEDPYSSLGTTLALNKYFLSGFTQEDVSSVLVAILVLGLEEMKCHAKSN